VRVGHAYEEYAN